MVLGRHLILFSYQVFWKLGTEIKIWNQNEEWLPRERVSSCLGKKIGAKWNTRILEKEEIIK